MGCSGRGFRRTASPCSPTRPRAGWRFVHYPDPREGGCGAAEQGTTCGSTDRFYAMFHPPLHEYDRCPSALPANHQATLRRAPGQRRRPAAPQGPCAAALPARTRPPSPPSPPWCVRGICADVPCAARATCHAKPCCVARQSLSAGRGLRSHKAHSHAPSSAVTPVLSGGGGMPSCQLLVAPSALHGQDAL